MYHIYRILLDLIKSSKTYNTIYTRLLLLCDPGKKYKQCCGK